MRGKAETHQTVSQAVDQAGRMNEWRWVGIYTARLIRETGNR